MIRELDLNGDWYIDLEEFVDAIGVNITEYGNMEDDLILLDAFLIFESDKNGFITPKGAAEGTNWPWLQEMQS